MSERAVKYGGYKGYYRALDHLKAACGIVIDVPAAGYLDAGIYTVSVADVTLAQTFFDLHLVGISCMGTHRQRIYLDNQEVLNALSRVTGWQQDDPTQLRDEKMKVTLAWPAGRYRISRNQDGTFGAIVDGVEVATATSIGELTTGMLSLGVPRAYLEVTEWEDV